MPTIELDSDLKIGNQPVKSAYKGTNLINLNVRNTLFAGGEQGVWYDPSDLSTLYQDAAGTTPVTAMEQPVGLMLDKSKGLVLGPELVTNGGPFSATTGWLTASATPLSVSGGVLTGSTTAATDAFIYGAWLGLLGSTAVNKYFEIRATITAITGRVRFKIYGSNVKGPWITAPGTYSIRLYQTVANGNVGLNTDQATSVSISSISVRELPGNHATQSTTTSRPTLQQDTSGKYYLSFDGVDDSLSTGSVDFTGTDKMTVCAGVRKLSDAAPGVAAELGTGAQNGSFLLAIPANAGPSLQFFSRGTANAFATANSGYAAPITNVVTGLGDISGDLATLRVNGTQAASRTADQGTGNYGNYPLYIGRRGGTSLPFNGRLYGLIVRGAQTDDLHLTNAEKYLAHKSGVTL